MGNIITHIICIGFGTLLLGPGGIVAGFGLAWYLNAKSRQIEAQWAQDIHDTHRAE